MLATPYKSTIVVVLIYIIIIIVHLESRLLQKKLGLGNVSNSSKDLTMLGPVVSKAVRETAKLLEQTIDAFMPCPGHSLHILVCIVLSSWSQTPAIAITVRTIGQV